MAGHSRKVVSVLVGVWGALSGSSEVSCIYDERMFFSQLLGEPVLVSSSEMVGVVEASFEL